MKYFSIPADFKTETIDRFYELNSTYGDSKVIEIYGQITTGNILNSGRVTDVLPKVDFSRLEKYVRYSKDKGISFNYTLNPACFGNYEFSQKGSGELKELLKKLADIGVKNLTVTSPPLMELVQASGLGFEIKASAICEITSPGKAQFYKNLGVNRIVIDPDITRDFEKIKNICGVFRNGVEMIINNVCYKHCAYKMFHYNHDAHCTPQNTSQTIRDYYFNRCSMQKAGGFRNSMRLNWVRPEDLKYYQASGIRHFKIQGRQNVMNGDIVRAVKHYFDEDYSGNLFDLITIFAPYNAFQPVIDNKKLDGFIQRMYEHPGFCRDVCAKCNYCDAYAEKCMDKKEVTEKNMKALSFYQDYDEYTRVIRENRKEDKQPADSRPKAGLSIKFEFED